VLLLAATPHDVGRGVDIARVEGEIVNTASAAAHDLALGLSSLEAGYRPDVHIAFTQPIDPSWTPPTG
jgi:hypothetical protein